jgi:hypothetical protein
MKTGIQLIKEFFGDVRAVGLDELKALPKADRKELAELIAQQQGLVPVENGGQVVYNVAAAA